MSNIKVWGDVEPRQEDVEETIDRKEDKKIVKKRRKKKDFYFFYYIGRVGWLILPFIFLMGLFFLGNVLTDSLDDNLDDTDFYTVNVYAPGCGGDLIYSKYVVSESFIVSSGIGFFNDVGDLVPSTDIHAWDDFMYDETGSTVQGEWCVEFVKET